MAYKDKPLSLPQKNTIAALAEPSAGQHILEINSINLGAPPSNTAPSTCNTPSNFVVHYGIDSLYLSFPGTLFESIQRELDVLKSSAQTAEHEDRASAIYILGEHQFMVSDKGTRRFRFVLTDYAYRIEISGADSKQLPLAHIQIRSEYLSLHGPEFCVKELHDCLGILGQLESTEVVSRADLFVDVVSDTSLNEIDEDAFVTRARYKQTHRLSRLVTGYSISPKANLSARLYDKIEELKVSGKEYLTHYWKTKGWVPPQTVLRLEFQLRRSILGEHGIQTLSDLLSKRGALWRYCTTQWLRLTLPSDKDKTQSRWPLHPLWELFSNVEWDFDTQTISFPLRTYLAPSDQRLFVHGLSPITSYMAREGITDVSDAINQYFIAAQQFHDSNADKFGIDFETYVITRAKNKARSYGLSWPGELEKSREIVTSATAKAYELEQKKRDPMWWDVDE